MLDRISADASCVLERGRLEGLANDGELMVYEHDGFWQCADTVRDVELLRGLWDAGDAPWRLWDDRELLLPVEIERRREPLPRIEAAA